MNIIGRKEEQSILRRCVESKRPEFLVVYGRRRVGKTFLVKEFFNNDFSFYATGVPNTKTGEQLRVFGRELKRYGAKEKNKPADWLEAFDRLRDLLEDDNITRYPGTGKRVVFLDELPWMDTPRSDFRIALDYFWNSWGSSQEDLLLIVCGSATSWIINNILTNTGGLYNRITGQIHLSPFCLRECEELLNAKSEGISRKQIIDLYMVFGGIPYYLNMFDKQLSVAQNVERLIFNENGPLHSEHNVLMRTLFRYPEKYERIIGALVKRKSGMTRGDLLKEKNMIQGNALTKALKELEECRFLRKYKDYTLNKQGYIYQLIDPFILFGQNFLEDRKVPDWSSYIGTPGYYAWRGNSFEILCLNHLPQIKSSLGISGISSMEYSWRSKKGTSGVQIDLLIDRRDDVINVCEMKYPDNEFVVDGGYEKQLAKKLAVFRNETGTHKSLQLVIIAAEGLKRNAHLDEVMHIITGDDLFRD